MRIGVDIRHLGGGNPSGIGQYTLAILRVLVQQHPEHDFVLITSGSPYKAKLVVSHHLKNILGRKNVVHIHHSILNKLLNLQIFLTGHPSFDRLFGKQPVDVIWCPNLNFLPKSRTPIVVTFHDLSFELLPDLYSGKRRLWHRMVQPKRIAKRACLIISPSKTTASDLFELYGIDPMNIRIIPHGVDETFSEKPTPQDHGVRSRHDLPRHYLLHIGTDEPRKNRVRLVRAFEEAKRRSEFMRRLDVKLVLAGSSQIKRPAGLTPSPHRDVLSLGYLPDADRPALYRGATALVFPSLYEGFGMPILEAFASGTPVITSQNSAMLEVGGTAVVFVDPENEEDLVRAILAVVEDQTLQDHLKTQGLNRVEKASWETSAEATLKALEEALPLHQVKGQPYKH
ncbi:MAG: AprM [Candidatus Giovannonibacteria bacterium GW2011_GWA2_53_7]|uniref:AprM n=1 Tax=Candidatus Giovannonibacteria bacterium GW2011_GWA2_53_7 TaxID=1618650 RepID=A0A0G1XY83_9BACT|nr:MAG: AprM [Candidatus Giovannonibacteria bacterium GW2011_GWA2_53_7]